MFAGCAKRLLVWTLSIVSLGINQSRLGPQEHYVNNFREGTLIVYQSRRSQLALGGRGAAMQGIASGQGSHTPPIGVTRL